MQGRGAGISDTVRNDDRERTGRQQTPQVVLRETNPPKPPLKIATLQRPAASQLQRRCLWAVPRNWQSGTPLPCLFPCCPGTRNESLMSTVVLGCNQCRQHTEIDSVVMAGAMEPHQLPRKALPPWAPEVLLASQGPVERLAIWVFRGQLPRKRRTVARACESPSRYSPCALRLVNTAAHFSDLPLRSRLGHASQDTPQPHPTTCGSKATRHAMSS
mmetsp:Transcript_95684/g.160808  ORF Transcript_95684/g.160808 Transcript_95684/m.160808 type:complete len:216 (+) Transcript_95684:1654-2301(+)